MRCISLFNLLFGYLLVCLVGCNYNAENSRDPDVTSKFQTVILNPGDDEIHQKMIKLEQSYILSVIIPGQPSTGYGWYLENLDDIDQNYLKPLNLNWNHTGSFTSNYSNEGIMGSEGFFKFKFYANKKSIAYIRLSFVNKRPWESEIFQKINLDVKIVSKGSLTEVSSSESSEKTKSQKENSK